MNILRRFLLNLPFASKVIVLFVILAVSLALLIVAIVGSLYHQRDSQRWALHAEEVLLSTEYLQRYSIEIVGASRGHQLKPSTFFIDLINDRKSKMNFEKEHLRNLVSDNPSRAEKYSEIESKVNHLMNLVDTDMLKSRSEKLPEHNDLQSAALYELKDNFAVFAKSEEKLSTERLRKLISSFKRSLKTRLTSFRSLMRTSNCS